MPLPTRSLAPLYPVPLFVSALLATFSSHVVSLCLLALDLLLLAGTGSVAAFPNASQEHSAVSEWETRQGTRVTCRLLCAISSQAHQGANLQSAGYAVPSRYYHASPPLRPLRQRPPLQ